MREVEIKIFGRIRNPTFNANWMDRAQLILFFLHAEPTVNEAVYEQKKQPSYLDPLIDRDRCPRSPQHALPPNGNKTKKHPVYSFDKKMHHNESRSPAPLIQ